MKTILLVDDSRAIRMAERRILRGLGVDTLEAENGWEALRVLHQQPQIDAVLLDWNMPVMNGLECLKALRCEFPGARPLVVMCTTENDAARMGEALEAGATEYLTKPFTEDSVREKFASLGVLAAESRSRDDHSGRLSETR